MATPLRPFDLRELVENSLAWAVLHPGQRARDLLKEHRIDSTLARAAYSVATRATDAPDLDHGISPCLLCGVWTHSWCESCLPGDLGALCRSCDEEQRVCPDCARAGRSWSASRAAHDAAAPPGEVIEVYGYEDADGAWQSFPAPIQIPASILQQEGEPLDLVLQWLEREGHLRRWSRPATDGPGASWLGEAKAGSPFAVPFGDWCRDLCWSSWSMDLINGVCHWGWNPSSRRSCNRMLLCSWPHSGLYHPAGLLSFRRGWQRTWWWKGNQLTDPRALHYVKHSLRPRQHCHVWSGSLRKVVQAHPLLQWS